MAIERTGHRPRPPSLFWPLLLITAGALFLLQNLGYLPWGFWGAIWRFWPVLLIIIGVQLFFGRQYPWLAAGVVVVLLIAAVAGAALLPRQLSDLPAVGRGFGSDREQVVTQELGSLEQARVELKMDAGRLKLGSLPEGSRQLAEARMESASDRVGINRSMQTRGARGTLRLEASGDWFPLGDTAPYLLVKLSPKVPLDIDLSTGAGESDVDLTDLRVEQLVAETGAGSATVRLPSAGQSQARVQAGVGELTVSVPEGVAARIRVESGLGSVSVDQSRFPRSGDAYVSPGFDKAMNRVDLKIQAGMGSIRVQ